MAIGVSKIETARTTSMGITTVLATASKASRGQARVSAAMPSLLGPYTPSGLLGLSLAVTSTRRTPLIAPIATSVATAPAPKARLVTWMATSTSGVPTGPATKADAEATLS